MKKLNPSNDTLIAMAIDFWLSQGRTLTEIVLSFQSDKTKDEVMKPAIDLYNKLWTEFELQYHNQRQGGK